MDLLSLKVPCIEDLPAIQDRCEKLGLHYSPEKANKCETVDDIDKNDTSKKSRTAEYEVEEILDIKIERKKEHYLVKWKGWSSLFNSWEPFDHLSNCPSLLMNFHQRIKSRIASEKDSDDIHLDRDDALKYIRKRTEVKSQLKIWETEINSNLPSKHAPIQVENEVDLEGVPENFTYINDYKAGEGIKIPDDPIIGCGCDGCFQNKNNCCSSQCGFQFAYDKKRKLVVPPGTPIYECNIRCKCGPQCYNRVVQLGHKVKMAIFRTSNECGWGVKTLQNISKNSFVMEYVGEIISTEEAEKRGKVYDEQGRTYLFDLDFEDSDCPYTVDAANFGNIAHFMNHSCDPNLIVYGVWINNLEPGMPRLAYFSKRDIATGEELTFDYMMSTSNTSRSPDDKVKQILCKCGADNCKKFLIC